MRNPIVTDLGALYVALCYLYSTQDISKGNNKVVYSSLKDLYLEEAEEDFPESILERIEDRDVNSEMLYALIDSINDAIDPEAMSKFDHKLYKKLDQMCNRIREDADGKQSSEFLLSPTDGADLDMDHASKIVETFLNGAWIKTFIIQRPGMRRGNSAAANETYGVYDRKKNTATAFLEDDKPYQYTARVNAIAAWFASEIKNYSTYLKGLAKDDSDSDSDLSYLSELLSGIMDKSYPSTERDWAEGSPVEVTMTGLSIPGVALQVRPVNFSTEEVRYMASQIEALNELANRVEGICVTPDAIWFGEKIKVDLAVKMSKFADTTRFKSYNLDLVNIDRPAQALVSQIKAVLAKPKDEKPKAITSLFYGVPGSGKSMLAGYIGDQLGLPVIKRTYAELQSMYVGEGEKQLREAFEEAEAEGAVLLIDELDSIAGNRKDAEELPEDIC